MFTGCGGTRGNTAKFYVVLKQDETISIGLTTSTFDSMHSLFWSESADPTSYSSVSGGQCVDDPDTKTLSLTNTFSAPRVGGPQGFPPGPRKVWFVVNDFGIGIDFGQFTISWAIESLEEEEEIGLEVFLISAVVCTAAMCVTASTVAACLSGWSRHTGEGFSWSYAS